MIEAQTLKLSATYTDVGLYSLFHGILKMG